MSGIGGIDTITLIDGIPLGEYLKMYFERSVAVQTFWTLYITVAVGAVTFICTARIAFIRPSFRWILGTAFFIFSISNLDAMLQVNAERAILVAQISRAINGGLAGLDTVISPPNRFVLIGFHLAFSALVIFLIYIIPIASKNRILRWSDRQLDSLQRRIEALRSNKQNAVTSEPPAQNS